MRKKILNFGIVIMLSLAGVLSSTTIVDIGSSLKITKNKKIIQTENDADLAMDTESDNIGLLTAELMMREEGEEWHKNSISTKVGSTIEYKLLIKPYLEEKYENVHIVFAYDIYFKPPIDPPDDWEDITNFDYIEGSLSDTEHCEGHLPGFFIIWIVPTVTSPLEITFKAKATEKVSTKAAVIAAPESINSIGDLAFDADRLTITKAKSKSFPSDILFNGKLMQLLEKISSLKIFKNIPVLKILFNLEHIKSISERTFHTDTNLNKNTVNPSEEDESDSYYCISAKDSSDKLDNSLIDNIATIALKKGKDLSLSNVEIYLSNDMINWIKADIIDEGIWNVGDEITIKEKRSDDISPGGYTIRLINPSISKYPLSECMVKTEKSSQNNCCDKRYTYDIKKFTGDNIKKSRAYCSCDANDYNYANMIYSAVLRKIVWDSDHDYWEYYFDINGYEQSEGGLTSHMRMYAEISDSINNKYYPVAGSTGLDETNDDEDVKDIRDGLILLTEAVISYAYPWMAIPITAKHLANLLMDSPEYDPYCDLDWKNNYPPNQQPEFHDCCAQMKLSIYPENNWNVKLNLETEFRTDVSSTKKYHLFLDSKDEWPAWPMDMHPNGEGKIKFNGESPKSGEVDIRITSEAFNIGLISVTVDDLVVGTTAHHADHVRFTGDAYLGPDMVETVYEQTEDQFFECFITDNVWIGKVTAVSEDDNNNFIDSDYTPGLLINLPFLNSP